MMHAVAEICQRNAAARCLGLARNADGLRHRHLLQLRHEGPPDRTAAGTRKRTCVEGPIFDARRSNGEGTRHAQLGQRPLLSLERLDRGDSRDFVREAAFAWMTLRAALSSFAHKRLKFGFSLVKLLFRDRGADFTQLMAQI